MFQKVVADSRLPLSYTSLPQVPRAVYGTTLDVPSRAVNGTVVLRLSLKVTLRTKRGDTWFHRVGTVITMTIDPYLLTPSPTGHVTSVNRRRDRGPTVFVRGGVIEVCNDSQGVPSCNGDRLLVTIGVGGPDKRHNTCLPSSYEETRPMSPRH